jgi:beta-1,2-mannobiose phosphorylase / 1,2-beta-oligomannan phosphorylase
LFSKNQKFAIYRIIIYTVIITDCNVLLASSMFKILKITKSRSPKNKTFFFCRHKNVIYLTFKSKKTNRALRVLKSNNGFDFKKDRHRSLFVKTYPKIKKKKAALLHQRYHHLLTPGSEYINPETIIIENAFITEEGVLVFFHYQNSQNNQTEIGVVAFTKEKDPQLLWRNSEPVWQIEESKKNNKNRPIFIDLLKIRQRYLAYWLIDEAIWVIVYPDYRISEQIKIRKSYQLTKPDHNPLVKPKSKNAWEAFNTFNPAAIYEAEKVHIFYRAQGFDYVSSIGYATSSDGTKIDKRFSQPVFSPTQPFESTKKPGQLNTAYTSGGCGGCEDPRVTRVEDRIYMTYVAFDGVTEPRIALTSVSLKNFLNRNWLWKKPVLISPPGVVDKSACILPEKINGQYVIFHRIFPNILIDFVDSLDFSDGKYLEGQYKIKPRSPIWWDSRKIGAGAPPLKTKDGWLLVYQAVDDKEGHRYKVGAMLLDLDNPTKVLCRSRQPIIEPDQWYDNDGFKAGVVYPCGAVIISGTLFVYYGGADSYVCVATANLENFLHQLKTTGDIKLKNAIIKPKKKRQTKKIK